MGGLAGLIQIECTVHHIDAFRSRVVMLDTHNTLPELCPPHADLIPTNAHKIACEQRRSIFRTLREHYVTSDRPRVKPINCKCCARNPYARLHGASWNIKRWDW